MRHSPPNIEDLFRQIRSSGLDRIPDIHDLMEWAQLDPNDESVIKLLQEALEEEGAVAQLNPDPFRPTMPHNYQLLAGDLKLGRIPQNNFEFGLSTHQLLHQLLVLGRAGGGKTTLIRHLLFQLAREHPETNLLILERKQEYTELLTDSSRTFHVLDLNSLRLNVLEPPEGVPFHVWISVFTQMMVNYLDIRLASSEFLLKQLKRLMANESNSYPTLQTLYHYIAGLRFPAISQSARYQETLINRLGSLLDMLPNVFDCQEGMHVRDLLNQNTLLLLHDIPNLTVQNFLFSLILAQVFLYRIITEGHQPALRNLLVLDEASALFRRQDEIREGVSYLSYMVSQARGYGLGLIAASQYTSDLSHTLLANTGTKILVGGLGRAEDLDLFLKQRPISPEQRQHVMSHPDVGRAFIADSRYPYLLECRINPPPPVLPPDETTLKHHIERTVETLGFVDPPAEPKPEPEEKNKEDPAIPVLHDIYNTPFQLHRKRAAKLNINGTTLQHIIKQMIADGYIKDYPVHGKRGGPRDLYEVIEKGCALIQMPKVKLKGRGGYLHQFYQKMISEFLTTRGWKVELEGLCGSKNVDLIATNPTTAETMAVEIELHAKTDPDHVIHNITSDLASGRVQKVLSLVPKKGTLTFLKKLVQSREELLAYRDQIELDRLCNYWEDN